MDGATRRERAAEVAVLCCAVLCPGLLAHDKAPLLIMHRVSLDCSAGRR